MTARIRKPPRWKPGVSVRHPKMPRNTGLVVDQRAAQLVYDLMADVKMPLSLENMGFKHEVIPKMAEVCITRYPRVNNPRPMSKEECVALFESMWEGKVTYL